MDSNSFLAVFGLKPEDFCKVDGPVVDESLVFYEAWEAKKGCACPKCGKAPCHVHHRYCSEVKARGDALRKEIVCIHRIVYRCAACGKTFTNPIRGIEESHRISILEKAAILAELRDGETFTTVAKRHSVSVTEAVSIFDEAYPTVGRKRLPRILLIDEFKFKTDAGKYVCHLVDFEASETVDVIKSRTKAYLDSYFADIPEAERAKVKYLVTDMYDEYRLLAGRWLPNAKVVADRFHVVKQLTGAVNSIRIAAMSAFEKGDPEYAFMKQRWRFFLCRKKDIPDAFHVSRKTGESVHFDDMVDRCTQSDGQFREAWGELQEIFGLIKVTRTFEEALKEVDFASTKLKNCQNWRLKKVGETYEKWRIEIARGMAKSEFGMILSNGKMEAANDVAQTFIDAAYGYGNFERFRKRFLLLRWGKKE